MLVVGKPFPPEQLAESGAQAIDLLLVHPAARPRGNPADGKLVAHGGVVDQRQRCGATGTPGRPGTGT